MLKQNKGFTLLELTLVLIISGVIILFSTSAYLDYIQQDKVKTTKQRLDINDEAVQRFFSVNGAYPCPAPFNTVPEDANFGVADCSLTSGGTNVVLQGAVPVKTLGIPEKYAGDGWGNKFRYAVTLEKTDPATFASSEGDLQINTLSGASINDTADYLIISHGPDGSGAYPLHATTQNPCIADREDTDNCGNDPIFTFSVFQSQTSDSTHYDDLVHYRIHHVKPTLPVGTVLAFNRSGCPQGWRPYTAGEGRLMVGTDDSDYNVGDTAGSPTKPASVFGFNSVATSPTIEDRDISGNPVGTVSPITYLGESAIGLQDPVNTMPPYIPLLYCTNRP